jgi:DNA topoisomerase-1
MKIGKAQDGRMAPPKPFHTSSLLQCASNQLHCSPKETMKLCQELYQNGYITYMRTDSTKYSRVFLDKAAAFITKTWLSDKYIGNCDALENKNKTLPHEAIRVTSLETRTVDSDNKRASALYKLIWKNTVESCMSEYQFQTTQVLIHPSFDIKLHWSNTIEVPTFLGWRKVMEKELGTDSPIGLLHYLQSIDPTQVAYSKITSSISIKNKHQYYTEASLIQTLEKKGIGRPSTYATIIDTIKERDYVKCTDVEGILTKYYDFEMTDDGKIKQKEQEKRVSEEKKKIVIQPIGISTIELLLEHFRALFEYEYTENMETQLDQISSGQGSALCSQCDDEIKKCFVGFKARVKEPRALKPTTAASATLSSLGKYKDQDVFVKTGKFGPYIQWGDDVKQSAKDLLSRSQKTIETITLEEIIDYLENKPFKIDKNVLRILTPNLSIRKGKFGAYLFYKTQDMKAPQFFPLKGFMEGWGTCSIQTLVKWTEDTYNIDV